MENNEEEDCDNNFPCYAGFGAFDDDTAMKSLKERQQMRIPSTILGRRCMMRVKIVKVKRRG
jgi:hypothetical protein